MNQSQSARVFVLLLASQSVSLLGSRMSAVAVGLWLFTTTGAVTPLALTALAAVLPRLLFTGPAGLLADRCDRRWVLLGAEVLQALASLLLLLDLVAGTFVTWHLYALAALQSAGAALQEPALLAMVTQLVPPEHRTRANALQQLGGPLAAVLAPALAGLVLEATGVVAVVAIDLLSFAIAVAVLAVVRVPCSPERACSASLGADAHAGLRYLSQRHDLLARFGLLGLANAVLLGAYLLYPPYLSQRTGSVAAAGLLLGLIPLGALIGGGLLTLAGRRVGSWATLPALLASGLCLAAIGIAQTELALATTLLALAICPAFVHVPLITSIQQSVPDALHGRVFAAQTLVAQLLVPAVYLGVGPLVDLLIAPLSAQPAWLLVVPLVGSGPGSALGLLFVLGGGLLALLTGGWLMIEMRCNRGR